MIGRAKKGPRGGHFRFFFVRFFFLGFLSWFHFVFFCFVLPPNPLRPLGSVVVFAALSLSSSSSSSSSSFSSSSILLLFPVDSSAALGPLFRWPIWFRFGCALGLLPGAQL